MRQRPAQRSQLGLTLIEMMLSITIGLVVVGAVTYLYVGSRGAYRGNEGLARIQEAGRFALDAITRDIRRSGALGCGSRLSASTGQPITVTALPAGLVVSAATQIQGFTPAAYYTPLTAAPTGWTAPTGPNATYWGGDVLQVQIATGVPVRVIASPDGVTGTIPIASNSVSNSTAANFANGDLAVLANCSAATVFQVSGVATTGSTATLNLATGVPMSAFAFDSRATVQHFDQVTYYVGQVPNSPSPAFPSGLPALYRYSLATGKSEELVENIEDMDVVYGVATAGSMATGTFKHADAMLAVDWPNVVSVRVSVIAVSDTPGSAPLPQTLLFRGTGVNPVPTAATAWAAPDARLRQVFTATAAVRDRLL